jgi:hypothetical protein
MTEINLSLKPILNSLRVLWDQLFAPILNQVVDFIVNKSGLPDEVVVKILLWTTAVTGILGLATYIAQQIKKATY